MFTGCYDKGIYRGPMKKASEFIGDHEVVMISCEKRKWDVRLAMRKSMLVKDTFMCLLKWWWY